jgi:hypothetical protein
MSNMSYCRFHNTRMDLNDCLEAIDNEQIESKSEVQSGKSMFYAFLEYCKDKGIIEEYDEDYVEDLFDNALMEEEDEDE